MSYVPPYFRVRIQEAKEKQLTELDLSNSRWADDGKKLNYIPAEVFELEHLESLNLSWNRITEIPRQIIQLKYLKYLNLVGNKLVNPEVIAKLPNLIFLGLRWNPLEPLPDWVNHIRELALDLSENQLTTLPESVTKLPNLTQLDLWRNNLTTLPESITELPNLTQLDLWRNNLTILPESITELPSLTQLYLSDNHLTTLPESITKIPNLTQLYLSGNQLKYLPEYVTEVTNLTRLYLSRNQLKTLPKSLANLTNLTGLNLSSNQLENLPESITKLSNLAQLDLCMNQLTNLPTSIKGLTKLNRLDLCMNQLIDLPEPVTRLTSLTKLNLSGNQLKTLPKSIVNLTNLTQLDLSENQLALLPDFITNLTSLVYLNLRSNQLKEMPESISQFTNLTRLDLSNNQLKNLPESIGQLTNLTQLSLRDKFGLWDNPLETPPIEIAEQGIEAIREYFRQLKQEGTDYIYEAKLLIVGEAGAGKTTLTNKIQNPDYQLQDEDYTQGIDVITWHFPMANGHNFRVNIWDFGGQEIYHATHQFFLTKRSLYTLVADTRKEDTDFYYWLNVVELLSDNSPLLIIKNEKQDRTREINERALRGEFTNFKETLATNLADNRGLPEILTKIRHYISNLDHVGSALPKTWTKVRKTLEADTRNYISQDEYFQICQHNGFSKRQDKLQLSGYLHDLGVCLHFQDDPLLKQKVILKPEWGTAAVYKVLDNETVRSNLGRFTKQDLVNIWSEEKYVDMQDELLKLMMKFQLCYRIPGTQDTYIAPQFLTENQPEYDWDEDNNLILRYTYEFMPKGIITQFIVAMHSFIDKQQYVWKSGVILQKDETFAEVIENYGKREIKIRVAGKHKRDLMTNVIYELGKIHDSYKRLKYNQLIPCNCFECKNSQNPHFYPFNVLRQFNLDRKDIQCQKSYAMVNVQSLIDDVSDPARLREINDDLSESNRSQGIQIHINNHQMQSENTTNQSGNFGIGQMSGGTIEQGAKIGGIINEAPSQNLAQAAAEIQHLLEQLQKSYPSTTLTEKAVIAEKTIEKIEANPTLKQRIINAIKEMGIEAFMELIDHPVANVLRAGVEGWQEGE